VGWEPSANVPERFHPSATRLRAEAALVGGYLQGGEVGAVEDQRAEILRWDGGTPVSTYSGPGWIVTLDVAGESAWAIAAELRPEGVDSSYRALRSIDGGRSWNEAGPVPASSVTDLRVVGPMEAWVLGGDTLLRTVDGGASWVQVHASGTRDGVEERLAVVGGRVLILGAGVRATADGGLTWLDNGVDGSRVYAVDGSALLADHEGELKLGFMEAGGPRWIAAFPAGLRPFRLVAEGSHLRWLAYATRDGVGVGLRLYESNNGGQAWSAWRLPAQAKAEAADLGKGSAAVFLDPRRRLFAAPGTFAR